MQTHDFSEIEAAFNADQDEVDAIVLERWKAHLKKRPVKGDGLDLEKIKASLNVHHGGPGPHKSGSSQDVHGKRGAGVGAGKRVTSFPTRPAHESLTDEQDRRGWEERKLIDDNGQEVVFKETPEEYEKGVFTSFRVTVEGNGDAILKTNVYAGYSKSGWGDEELMDGFAKREVAAYKVDQTLGLGVVPETIGLEWGSEGNQTAWRYQSLQKWVDDATAGFDASGFKPGDLKEPEDIGRILLLDKIIGQRDRHGYNWLVADGRIVAIDHGLGLVYNDDDPSMRSAFPMMYSTFGIDRSVNNPNVNRPYLPRSYRETLRSAIDSGDLYKALSEVGTDEKNDRLVSAAMFRAENIYNDWDSYFSDENWY